jgi:hypothetical protein
VEVNNRHYVFGSNDIWMHDGLSMTSIADKRVRKWVYKNMNASLSNRFFVSYNPSLNTISFNFVSGDGYVGFNGEGCNRAAVYSITNGTWVFDDLPLVHSAGYAKVSLSALTWATVTSTWETAWWLVAGPRRRLQARSSVRGRDETGCCSSCVRS